MAKQPPHPFQKLVRGFLRDVIHEVGRKPTKSKRERATNANTSKQKPIKKSRSRYIPASIRVSVLHRDGYKCVYCGRSSRQIPLEVDHILPFSKGGSNDLSNLQALCIDCNRGKGARHLK